MSWAPTHCYEFQCPRCGAKASSRCIMDGKRDPDWGGWCDERQELFEFVVDTFYGGTWSEVIRRAEIIR